jgi:hypothetical protein
MSADPLSIVDHSLAMLNTMQLRFRAKTILWKRHLRSGVMKTPILWRNPVSLIKTKRAPERIRTAQFGAVYMLSATDTA